jgi:hypothetical protein
VRGHVQLRLTWVESRQYLMDSKEGLWTLGQRESEERT